MPGEVISIAYLLKLSEVTGRNDRKVLRRCPPEQNTEHLNLRSEPRSLHQPTIAAATSLGYAAKSPQGLTGCAPV